MRATATVDLAVLRRNVQVLQSHLTAGTQMLVAVKGNAYGHGLRPVARTLEAHGVGWLGVATPDEALALRDAGIEARILMFGPQRGRDLRQLIEANVDLTVASEADLQAAQAEAETLDAREVRVHLKVDTGMGRLGEPPEAALYLMQAADRRSRLTPTGVWTHLACADEPDSPATDSQLNLFADTLETLDAAGLTPPTRHAANSAATLTRQDAHFDLVRPGIAVYGYPPSDALRNVAVNLTPAMTVDAPVVFVKDVPAGTPVSYGHHWRAPNDTRIATVRLGYADGYPRAASNRADMHAAGRAARVVGTVCMDQTMLDVADSSVQVGDRVTAFGPEGVGADDVARATGTIAYEILTAVDGRLERRYEGEFDASPSPLDPSA